MIRLTALLTAAALAVALGAPLQAQEPHRGGVAERPERPAAEERARGEGQGAQRRPEAAPASRRLPPDSITQHALELPGRTLRFTATAGSLPVVDQGGQLQAEIGVASYTLNGAEPGTRPVAFALNGGPGAASAYLHLLVLGPWRLPLDGPSISPSAATALVPNAETWLDFTDLVFIDPVDTGYSRAAGSSEDIRNRYFNIEGDVGTLSAVITRWLRQNNRLTSPKFLVGESYGGFRAPRIAHELQKDVGVGLNGIVMLSPVLDFGWFSQPRHAPWVHAVRLPSYVAAATEGRTPLSRDVLREAETYAAGDYLVDLTRGLQDKAAVERVVGKVQTLTGLDADVVRRQAGRLDTGTVQRELARSRGRVVSAYDAGVSGYDPDPTAFRSDYEDPGLTAMTAPLTSAIVTHLWQTLNWKVPDQRYNLLNGAVNGNWRWGRGRGQAESVSALRQALALDGNLQALVVHGFTDLVTPYFASELSSPSIRAATCSTPATPRGRRSVPMPRGCSGRRSRRAVKVRRRRSRSGQRGLQLTAEPQPLLLGAGERLRRFGALPRKVGGFRRIGAEGAAVGQHRVDLGDRLREPRHARLDRLQPLAQRRERGAALGGGAAIVLARARGGAGSCGGTVGAVELAGEHEPAVVVHVAVERAHGAAGDEPKAVGAGLDQEAVVADEDDRTLEVVDRLHQGGAAVDIEVVRRLVEDEEMGPAEGGKPHEQARLLAAGQRRDRRVGLGAGKAEPAAAGPDLRLRRVGHALGDVKIGRRALFQLVELVLGEIGRHELRLAFHRPGKRRQASADELAEGRLAVAVRAEERDAVVRQEGVVQAVEDRAPVIARRHRFHGDDRRA